MQKRSERKLDHIAHALALPQKDENGFENFRFVHNSLPLTNVADIDISTKMGDLYFKSPIFLTAMTGGGGTKTKEINQKLAIVAKETNMAMAVGSQKAALQNREEEETYKIVRKELGNGLCFANLGAECSADNAERAVHMIEANALQLHLNVIQELTMPEGDRDFRFILKNIEEIVDKVNVPVIVKEVGFGMSKDTVKTLENIGVSFIDVAGFGGTNFAAIENERRLKPLNYFSDWGIPTAYSLCEAVSVKKKETTIFASGGIKDPLDIVKSLSIGANAVGIAGWFLRMVMKSKVEEAIEQTNNMHKDIRLLMAALGAKTIDELKTCPLVANEKAKTYLEQRGINLLDFSMRSKTNKYDFE